MAKKLKRRHKYHMHGLQRMVENIQEQINDLRDDHDDPRLDSVLFHLNDACTVLTAITGDADAKSAAGNLRAMYSAAELDDMREEDDLSVSGTRNIGKPKKEKHRKN